MSIPKIDPYPPAPTPEDDEATFDEKAYEHAASLEPRRVQMNEVATYVNTRASDANSRAVAAAASATASSNSAARADEWANKAPGSVVASGKYSAWHYSDLSDKFANAPEDVEVEQGKYSAKHYMEKAKKIADVHATTVATDPLPTVLATNVQEALRDLAYQSDQLRIAKNQLKYGDGPYPVLDFQFAGAKYLDPRIQFTRASVDWDEDGNEYGIDEPVLTKDGVKINRQTSYLLLSSDPATSYWARTLVEISEIDGWYVATSPQEAIANGFFRTSFPFLPLFFVSFDLDLSQANGASIDFGLLPLSSGVYINGTKATVSPDGSHSGKSISVEKLKDGVLRVSASYALEDYNESSIRINFSKPIASDAIKIRRINVSNVPSSFVETDGSQVTVAPSFFNIPYEFDRVERVDASISGFSYHLKELGADPTGRRGGIFLAYSSLNAHYVGVFIQSSGVYISYSYNELPPVAVRCFDLDGLTRGDISLRIKEEGLNITLNGDSYPEQIPFMGALDRVLVGRNTQSWSGFNGFFKSISIWERA